MTPDLSYDWSGERKEGEDGKCDEEDVDANPTVARVPTAIQVLPPKSERLHVQGQSPPLLPAGLALRRGNEAARFLPALRARWKPMHQGIR